MNVKIINFYHFILIIYFLYILFKPATFKTDPASHTLNLEISKLTYLLITIFADSLHYNFSLTFAFNASIVNGVIFGRLREETIAATVDL